MKRRRWLEVDEAGREVEGLLDVEWVQGTRFNT